MNNNRPLTDTQKQVLLFIKEEIKQGWGAPTINEISNHFGWVRSGCRAHLTALEKKGYILRNGRSRGIKIIKRIRR